MQISKLQGLIGRENSGLFRSLKKDRWTEDEGEREFGDTKSDPIS